MGICTCFAFCSLEGTGFNVTMATCSFVRPHGDGAKDLKEMVLSLTGSVDRSGFLGKASVRSLMRSSPGTSEGIFEIRKVRAIIVEGTGHDSSPNETRWGVTQIQFRTSENQPLT